MIAVLLLGVLLILGLLALGVYLLFFRPDPPPETGEPRPVASAPESPGPGSSTESPGGGSGNGSDGGSESGSESSAVPDTADLEAVARDYVVAVNGRDEAAATALTCERKDPGTLYSVTGGREVRLVRVEVLEGAVGSAQLRVGDGETALLMEKREDRWCVAI
ncbi:MAG TPA: hypothetical protein VH969_20425 [Actinophytocola sp.]|jgi:hypothetical protein|uniref:hypothetical protein n=1 Tax=Actinophytocola sp. TaxID=1872138 RepID=UPI002F95FDF4